MGTGNRIAENSFSGGTLWRIGWRYLLRHPWQSVLMVVGIALGVAVAVAVDLANASAGRAFELSTESVTGRATHTISGGPQGLDESIYTQLKKSGLVTTGGAAAAPVLSEYVSSPQFGGQPLQLLGLDPFAEPPFRDYLGGVGGEAQEARPSPLTGDLAIFLTQPNAVLISTGLADQYGLRACTADDQSTCRITLEINGQTKEVFIAGLLQPADSLSQRALDGLIIADVATAQELTGRLGKLDRIDLILPKTAPSLEDQIRALLPPGAHLEPVAARSGTVEQMTAAFRINLTALSLLALVVGMFLIYNTMTFSVVQRRPMFGTLRCLGVTRREIFLLVLGEALLVGLAGSALGLLLGVVLGQGAVRLVTQTINDLFFVLTVRGVQIPLSSLVKGAVLGLAATLLTAAPPAWEAASSPPRLALSRSGLESKARRAVIVAAGIGLALLVIGALTLAIPTHSLVISFGGTFAVIVGCAMLAPLLTRWLMRLLASPAGAIGGVLGRLAPRNVISSLSRTAIAVAALMVAISVTIGVSLMVSSFRHTVVLWLENTLQGDVYISAPSLTSTTPSAPLDPQVIETARGWPGVREVDVLRSVNVDSPLGPVHIAATDNTHVPLERTFLARQTPADQLWAAMLEGGVLISEPLANRLGLHSGEALALFTRSGERSFPILGVFYDYASTEGTLLMALPVYRQNWDDPALTAAALRLEPGADPDQVATGLQAAVNPIQRLLVRPNAALRAEVLVVFDRTFAITGALQLLATLVAFIGVLSALLSLELERQRELGILRAIGLTVRQMWRLILLETGLLGFAAGLFSLPTGYVLALILVYIINRRSFGWTLQMQIAPEPFIQALLVGVLAALLAGLYPARRIGRMEASEALRSE